MNEKLLVRFHIKIFNQFGALVEDFALSAPTKRKVEEMVRKRMQANNMDRNCTFKIL